MKTRTSTYRGEHLNRIAFPLGGIGAGMISLQGTAALSQVSLTSWQNRNTSRTGIESTTNPAITV